MNMSSRFPIPDNQPQYPSKKEMLRNAFLTAKQVARDPRPAPKTMKSKRLEICNVCEWFDGQQLRCKACGCYLVAKAAMRGAKCPKGKWEEVGTDDEPSTCC